MFSLRINWAKVFSMGELVCFVATWVVSIWATFQTIDSAGSSHSGRMLATSNPLPMVAATME